MSSPEQATTPAAASELDQCADRLRELTDSLIRQSGMEDVSETAIQTIMTAAVKLYMAKRELDVDFPPVDAEALTPTHVALAVTSMLKAINMEMFELTLWNAMGRV